MQQVLVSLPLRSGGTLELRPDRLSAPGLVSNLDDIVSATLVTDVTVPVPAGAPPWPAISLALRDGRAPVLTPADPPDAWRLLQALYALRPALNMPLPPPPGQESMPGGTTERASGAPYGAGAYGGAYGAPAGLSTTETALAGLSHLSVFFAPMILPLIVWLATRDNLPYASRQGKQAFFFHLGFAVLAFVGIVGWFILAVTAAASTSTEGRTGFFAGAVGAFFFILLAIIALALVEAIFAVYAAIQAFQGKPFHYPLLGRI